MTDQPASPTPPETSIPGAPLATSTGIAAQQEVVTAEPGTSPLPVSGRKFPKPKKVLIITGIVFILSVITLLTVKLLSERQTLVGVKGEIVWWGLQLEETAVQPLIEDYQSENPEIKITYVKQSPNDYRARLANAFAQGEGPDIFRIHNSWPVMFRKDLDIMPPSIMSQEEFSQTFYPVIASDLTTEEGIVGFPLGFDALTMYINEDIFAAAAKSPPKTWDEFLQLSKELTQKNEQGVIIQAGAALGLTENVDHWPEILGLMMLQNGANPAKPTEQLARDALEFYSAFGGRGGVWDSTLPKSTVAFENEKLAMYIGPTWRADEINQANPNPRFKTVNLPQIRKEDPGQPDVSYATYWVEAVWSRSTNKEAAWDFLRFMTSRESLEKLSDNVKSTKLLGEPYPRRDMGVLLREHEIVGSVIVLAHEAKSWYLASETFDGKGGINSQINALFEELFVTERLPDEELEIAAAGIAKVLAQYGVRVR